MGLPLLVKAAFGSPDDHVIALQVQVDPSSNPMVKQAQIGGYVRLTRDEDYIRRVLTQNGYEDRDIETLAGYKGHVTKIMEMPGDGLVGVPGAKKGLILWLPAELLRVVSKDEALSFPSFEKIDSTKVIGVGDDVIYKGLKVRVYNIDNQGRLGVESLDGSQNGLLYVAKDSVVPVGPAAPNNGAWNSPESFAKQSGLSVGDLVRVTRQESKLRSQFAHDELKVDERMMGMLGKNFRIMAMDRQKNAIALPAPDGSGKKLWFPESLVKPADEPIDPNEWKEQEYNLGETVRLTSDEAAMKRQFPANFDEIMPMLGQTFVVKAVNTNQHAVALSSPTGDVVWFDNTLVQRQEEESSELAAPADLKAGEIVHVVGSLDLAKQNFAASSQPWNGDVSQMLGHDFKVLGVSGDGRLVALPDKQGLKKVWLPSTLVGRLQLPGRAAKPNAPVSGRRGLRPQWEDLKVVWLQETKTGNEGCASRRVKEASRPIWEDITNKINLGQIKTGPRKTALLEVEDVPWADLTWSEESKLGLPRPTLAGPVAEGLMKCVIKGFPSDIRLKAAAYLSMGGGANRRELPADLRSAASMQYMFFSLAAQEDKNTATELHRIENGKSEFDHKKEAAKLLKEARAEEDARWVKLVEKAAAKSHKVSKASTKAHKTAGKSMPRTKTAAKSKVESKTHVENVSPVMEEKADEVPVLKVQ